MSPPNLSKHLLPIAILYMYSNIYLNLSVIRMPTLETRNLIQVGDSLMIALPAGWLRYNSMRKGDQVTVIANGEIRVRPVKVEEHEKRKE
jgi:hypothetical protein